MKEREKYIRQVAAEWLRKQSSDIITGCDEIMENGFTPRDLPAIPGDISY